MPLQLFWSLTHCMQSLQNNAQLQWGLFLIKLNCICLLCHIHFPAVKIELLKKIMFLKWKIELTWLYKKSRCNIVTIITSSLPRLRVNAERRWTITSESFLSAITTTAVNINNMVIYCIIKGPARQILITVLFYCLGQTFKILLGDSMC